MEYQDYYDSEEDYEEYDSDNLYGERYIGSHVMTCPRPPAPPFCPPIPRCCPTSVIPCPCPAPAPPPPPPPTPPPPPPPPPPPDPPPPPPPALPWCPLVAEYNWPSDDAACPLNYRDEYLAGWLCTELPYYKEWYNRILLMPLGEARSNEEAKYKLETEEYARKQGECLEKYRKPCDPNLPAPWWPK